MKDYSQKKIRIYEIGLILTIFITSRFLSYYLLDIKPAYLNISWQLIPFELLKDDLFNSLFYLHTQPFLWNLITGIFIKLSNANFAILSAIFYLLNIFISFNIIFFSWLITRKINLSVKCRIFVPLIFTFSPFIIFYENLVYSYNNYSALVLVIFGYLTITLYKKEKFSSEIMIYILIMISSFIWALFQPLLIIIFFFIFRISIKKKLNFKKKMIIISILLVSFLPHIKNKFVYGIFTSSSWFGLNFSSTIAYHTNNKCEFHSLMTVDEDDFNKYFVTFNKKKNLLNHEMSNNNLYSVALIYKGKTCLNETKKLIKEMPYHWFKIRAMQIISSHGKLSIDFGLRPAAMNNIFRTYYNLNKNDTSKMLRKTILCLYMIFIYIFFIKLIFFSKNKIFLKKSYFCILLLYSYIITAGHLFNGVEHEKITYAAYFINILFVISLLNYFNNRKLTSVS